MHAEVFAVAVAHADAPGPLLIDEYEIFVVCVIIERNRLPLSPCFARKTE